MLGRRNALLVSLSVLLVAGLLWTACSSATGSGTASSGSVGGTVEGDGLEGAGPPAVTNSTGAPAPGAFGRGGEGGEGGPMMMQDTLLARVAEILGIEQEECGEAFEQARSRMQQEGGERDPATMEDGLFPTLAEILGIDQDDLEDAFAQARQELGFDHGEGSGRMAHGELQ